MPTSVNDLDLPTIDFFARDARSVGPAELNDIRTQSWLGRSPLGFVLTRYEDVVAILRDQRFHQASSRLAKFRGITDEEFLASRDGNSILSAEGDEHARLRRLVAPAFTPKSADALRPFMRRVINELVDSVVEWGVCDVVTDICEPYPIPIICELLGAPPEDWKLFSRWASSLLRIFDFDVNDALPEIKRASAELDAYVNGLIDTRRGQPGDDLLTTLIAAEEAGDRLSQRELVMLASAVLVAGTDTTRNQLACAVALFVEHPEQWKLLAEQPELAPRAVEEVMRVLGAVRGTGRFAAADVVYREVFFPEGTFISPSFTFANFDPAAFPGGDHFDITRVPSSQPQLTFGSGIHHCLGAALARAELQEALPVLARRLPDLAAEGDARWKPPFVAIWGPTSLPIRYTPTVVGVRA
jgi:cytochrome P450